MLRSVVCLSIWALLGFSIPAQNASQQRQAKPAPKERSESGKKSTSDNPKEDNKISADKELTSNQRQALDILNLLYNEAKQITDPQKRIKVQAQVADALWPYDAAKARQQFENSFRDIDALEKPKDSSDSARIAKDKSALESMTAVKDRLRRYVIRMLSHRDAKFADTLIRSQKASAEPGEGSLGEGERADLRLELAKELASSNPEQSAAIMRDTLRNGARDMLILSLMALRRKSPELADRVFSDALTLYGANKTYYSYDTLSSLGIYLIEDEAEKFISKTLTPNRSGREAVEKYLRFAYRVVAYKLESQQAEQRQSDSGIGDSYLVLHRLLPLFEQYLPEEGEMLRSRIEALSHKVSPKLRDEVSSYGPKDPTSVDDLVSKAESSGNLKEKDGLLTRAAMLAVQQDDVEKALFISIKINDRDRKESIRSIIHYQAGMKATLSKEIERALKHARETSNPVQRWKVFIGIVDLAVSTNDSGRARELLAEIENYVINTLFDKDPRKALGLLEIAKAWVKLDLSKATDLAGGVVKSLNTIDFNHPLEKGKTRITIEDFEFDPLWAPLARFDFNRALELARSIEKKDASTLAQISVCRTVLAELKR